MINPVKAYLERKKEGSVEKKMGGLKKITF